MRRTGGILFAILLALGSAAAGAQEPERIIGVKPDDSAMNEAEALAIATLPDFYAHLAAPRADESQFMLKFDILPGEGAEYVWANELIRSGGSISGVLMNQPAYTDDKLGDRVPIAEEDIIDWAYFNRRILQGGYTNRVLLGHMSPEEAEEWRRAFGW
jgi:uncharacterized protein YegJ (DUF2314 family)